MTQKLQRHKDTRTLPNSNRALQGEIASRPSRRNRLAPALQGAKSPRALQGEIPSRPSRRNRLAPFKAKSTDYSNRTKRTAAARTDLRVRVLSKSERFVAVSCALAVEQPMISPCSRIKCMYTRRRGRTLIYRTLSHVCEADCARRKARTATSHGPWMSAPVGWTPENRPLGSGLKPYY